MTNHKAFYEIDRIMLKKYKHGKEKGKEKERKKMIQVPFDEDINILPKFFDSADPETVPSLMYEEAYRRVKNRKADYIS